MNVWQRQYDLAQLKLLDAEKDLREMNDLKKSIPASERDALNRVMYACRGAIEHHKNQMKEAQGHL